MDSFQTAVMQSFTEDAEMCRPRLARYSARTWKKQLRWLDASGLALYLLDRLHTLGIEDVLPSAVLQRLSENQADNRLRMRGLLHEFSYIIAAFEEKEIRFVHVKGMTLAPESFAHPDLRCQLDLDFVVDQQDIQTAAAVLLDRGYVVSGETKETLEFKTAAAEVPALKDLYKPKPVHSVELHFQAMTAGKPVDAAGSLPRVEYRIFEGIRYPALGEVERFVGQAEHLVKHLSDEWTRASWILEYYRHVQSRRDDTNFWMRVEKFVAQRPRAQEAIGIATLLSFQILGGRIPLALASWSTDQLATPLRLWVECYGEMAATATFPGTKLYLLLKSEMSADRSAWHAEKWRRLVPLHREPRIVRAGPEVKQAWLWKKQSTQAYFFFFRAHFHLSQGIRYAFEAARWKRLTHAHLIASGGRNESRT